MTISAPVNMEMASGFAYSDINSLEDIKRGESSESIRASAQQFEALFIDQWLQSMRKAGADLNKDSYLSSNAMKQHQEMLDHQWSIHLAESGGVGLADVIVRQLDPSAEMSAPTPPAAPLSVQRTGFRSEVFASAKAFVGELAPKVRAALQGTPLDVVAVVSQAALETGWGRSVIHDAAGDSSHNLFGIKAGGDWQGETVSIKTMEHRAGGPRLETEHFRQYPDWESSVSDYVQFLSSGSRYQGALSNAAEPHRFADELKKAGYATDPAYADKLKSVIDRVAEMVLP